MLILNEYKCMKLRLEIIYYLYFRTTTPASTLNELQSFYFTSIIQCFLMFTTYNLICCNQGYYDDTLEVWLQELSVIGVANHYMNMLVDLSLLMFMVETVSLMNRSG